MVVEKNSFRRFLDLCLIGLLLWMNLAAYSGVPSDHPVPQVDDTLGFWDGDEIILMSIRFDFNAVLEDKFESGDYKPAVVTYIDSMDQEISLSGEIRTRGSFRLDPANCNFPPLKLRLQGKQREGTIFEGVKELKMVTHCQDDLPEYEQYLLQEYLIYKVFNILTDYSFRVRLAKVIYIDTGGSGRELEKYAFFLEDKDDLAERLGGNILDITIADPMGVDQDQYSLVSFFEFMIINTDWSLPIVHNVEILSTDYFKPPYTIPYDFDWSRIINIPYIVPGTGDRSAEGRIREFKGVCRSRKDFRGIIEIFNEHRLDIYRLYLGFEPLDNHYKQQAYSDYNTFYSIINTRELFRLHIREHCNTY